MSDWDNPGVGMTKLEVAEKKPDEKIVSLNITQTNKCDTMFRIVNLDGKSVFEITDKGKIIRPQSMLNRFKRWIKRVIP